MSKDLELQNIIPNGRHTSTTDDMSGSGSFTTPSPHDLSTDIIGAVAPMYATVPEAQMVHGRYQAQQVKSSAVPQTGYTTPGTVDPLNTYDMIPENGKKRERSHSPGSGGVPLMADNVLYGAPADEQLKHRTLTMEKAAAERQGQFGQRFTGSTSSQLMKEPGDSKEGAFTGRCCGVCLMLVLVFVVAFIAVAALVLVLSIMFRIYPVCECSSGSTSQEFMELQSKVDQLMATLQSQPTPPPGTPSTLELLSRFNNLSSRVDILSTTRVNSSLLAGTNYTSVISDFNLFQNCTTRIERRCNVLAQPLSQTSSYPLPCETFDNEIHKPGQFTMSMRCIRPSEPANRTNNAFVATLDITESENMVRCLCYAVQDDPNQRLLSNIECGLEVTRCTIPQTVTAEILVTP